MPSNAYPAADGPDRPIMDINGTPIGAVNDRWLTLTVDSDAAWDALRRSIGDARLDDPAYAEESGRLNAHIGGRWRR